MQFLVDKEGKVVERYAPTTSPQSIEVSNTEQHCIESRGDPLYTEQGIHGPGMKDDPRADHCGPDVMQRQTFRLSVPKKKSLIV